LTYFVVTLVQGNYLSYERADPIVNSTYYIERLDTT